MTIDRVIKAIQRCSHLSNAQMAEKFPELYELLFQEQLETLALNTRLATRSMIAEIQGRACPLSLTSPTTDQWTVRTT